MMNTMPIIKRKPQITRLTHEIKDKLTRDLKHRYYNKELIQHIESRIDGTTTQVKLEILYFFKKIVQQVHRTLYPDQRWALEELSEQEFSDLADEQEFYDPIKWINAEIEHLMTKRDRSVMFSEPIIESDTKASTVEGLMTFDQTMAYLSMSRSTLRRTMSNDMPVHKVQKNIYFCKSEVDEFVKRN